jgi:hypothetical protein
MNIASTPTVFVSRYRDSSPAKEFTCASVAASAAWLRDPRVEGGRYVDVARPDIGDARSA